MDDPEIENNTEKDVFIDAPDEFPFYDSISIHQNNNLSPNSRFSHSPTAPRLRRRSFSHRFRNETNSGNDSDPTSILSFNYMPDKENIKRVDRNLVLENEKSDFEGFEISNKRFAKKIEDLVDENENCDETDIRDDVAEGSDDRGDDSFVGLERKKRFGKKVEDLVDKSENSDSVEIKDDVAEGSEVRDDDSFVGLVRKKRFGKKVKGLVDENENYDVGSDSVVTEIKDDVAGGSEDSSTKPFVGFDYVGSEERRKRFIEKLEGLVDEDDDSKGFGIKDDNFDLPSGEIRSNLVTDSVNTEINDSNSNGSLGFDYTASEKRKKRFAKRLEELKTRKENLSLDVENRDSIEANCANDEDLVNNESSSGFLFGLAGLVIKAISLQLNLLVSLVISPIKFMYSVYMFFVDPFQVTRRGTEFVRSSLFKIVGFVCEKFVSFAGEWLKEHKSIWQLVLRFGWGFLWAAYVCIVLVSLLISAFVFSGLLMRKLVDEPIQMKEALTFDYTKNSPVAFVPITSCPVEPRDVSFAEKGEFGKKGFPRVIPHNHKLQATVSLVLPESDYNRNLGMFQVRVDLLSANGLTLASSRRSCMLRFKSQPIRMLLTFFKVAPLVTGYSSESQTLNLNLRGLIEKDIPTACLRIIIEQRAEFRPGAGSPEIYDAFLTLESELPLLKKLMWSWKKTLFIWLGLSMFTMQLLFALVCCRPLLLPRGGVRNRSAGNIARQDNHPAQR